MACEGPDEVTSVKEILLVPETIDFGPAILGETINQKISVRNAGRAKSAVIDVRSVGALASEFTVETQGFEIIPGEAKAIPVSFSPRTEGIFTAQVEVISDSAEGTRVVTLVGRGVKAAGVPNQSFLDFGSVELFEKTSRTLTFSNAGALAITIRVDQVRGLDADEFKSAAQTLKVPAGGSASVSYEFTPTRLGAVDAELVVVPCPQCPEQVVKFIGTGVASKLVVEPAQVDFGVGQLGIAETRFVKIRNLGSQPVSLSSAQILDDQNGVFQSLAVPAQISAAGELSIEVRFTAKAFASYAAKLRLNTSDARSPRIDVPLKATGGGPLVKCVPAALDFGTIVLGTEKTMQVVCTNLGGDVANSTGGALELKKAYVTGDAEFLVSFPVAQHLYAGQSFTLDVRYKPIDQVADAGKLRIETNDVGAPLIEIALAGNAKQSAPCQYTVTPLALNYGLVNVGATSVLGFRFKNTGTDLCSVTGLGLTAASDAAFKILNAISSNETVVGGAALDVFVQFNPTVAEFAEGAVEFYVNKSGLYHEIVQLSAEAGSDCLSLSPAVVDFGTVGLNCQISPKYVTVKNTCPTQMVYIDPLVKGAGVGDATDVSVTPANGFALAGGAQAVLAVTYQPSNEGADAFPFWFSDSTRPGVSPMALTVKGKASANPSQTDVFPPEAQNSQNKVDVLFVMDNSGSMMEEQAALAQNFPTFLSSAIAQGIDFQIGVTTTGVDPSSGGWTTCPGGVQGGEAGRLFPVVGTSPRIITAQTPNPHAVFSNNINVGTCHWDEKGLEAARLAVTEPLKSGSNAGFVRADAKLALVFVSDEEDYSTQPSSFYLSAFIAAKGGDQSKVTASAIVGPANLGACPTASASGSRYAYVANQLGGVVQSICAPDWSQVLSSIASSVFQGRARFNLSRTPVASSIVVTVDGVVATGWTYDAASNDVVFGNPVNKTSSVVITYDTTCN